jgi:hypothetical protein
LKIKEAVRNFLFHVKKLKKKNNKNQSKNKASSLGMRKNIELINFDNKRILKNISQ